MNLGTQTEGYTCKGCGGEDDTWAMFGASDEDAAPWGLTAAHWDSIMMVMYALEAHNKVFREYSHITALIMKWVEDEWGHWYNKPTTIYSTKSACSYIMDEMSDDDLREVVKQKYFELTGKQMTDFPNWNPAPPELDIHTYNHG